MEERRVSRDGESFDLIPYLRNRRDTLVIKPNDEYGGTGVTLGWETDEREWDEAIARALRERVRGWVAQERIAVRREAFPICESGGVVMRDMLVDLAPYVFPRQVRGFPDASERDRPCERDIRRRSGSSLRRDRRTIKLTMLFGPAGAELEPGARNAVEVCLGIRPDERVALIADEASGEVAASLAAALDQRWRAVGRRVDRAGGGPAARGAPPAVLRRARARRCRHSLHSTAPGQSSAPGWRSSRWSSVEACATRTWSAVTSQIMRQGMRADYKLVDELSQRLCERMHTARSLRVTSQGGTSLTATFDPSSRG